MSQKTIELRHTPASNVPYRVCVYDYPKRAFFPLCTAVSAHADLPSAVDKARAWARQFRVRPEYQVGF